MALKPLNSVGGFSVGEIPANVILANADITSNNLTVQKVANLGPVGNVIITGGSANQYLQTDGFGNLTFTTADTSRILNGNSNVSIPSANGNVEISVAGNANVAVFTGTGANVTGYLTASGNLTAANANLGNLVTANYANFTNDLVVQGNIANANNISVTNNVNAVVGNFSGNINSLNANLGNLATANFVNVASNITSSNLTVNLELAGNTANFTGNIAAVNANLGNLASANYVNVSQQINGNVGNFSGNVTALNADLGNLATANFVNVATNVNVTGTMQAGNVRTDNLLYANGNPWDLQEAAGSNTQIQYNDGLNNFGASANFTFDQATNVLTVNGNANVTNTLLTPNVNSGTGNLTLTSNGFSTVYDNTGNVTFPAGGTVTVGTLVGNVQANINITAPNTTLLFSDAGLVDGSNAFTFNKLSNSVTLTGNLQTDNANLGNLAYANYINAASNVTSNNVTVNLELAGNTANFSGNVIVPNLTVNTTLSGNVANFSGNVNANANLNVTLELAGNTANFSGNLTSQNANLGNLAQANFVNVASNLHTVNANVTGTLEVANANISSNLTVNNLTVNLELAGNTANLTGNVVLSGAQVTVNNHLAGNTANFSGNITSLNANLGNLVDANFIRTGELMNGNSNVIIAPNGNISLSATGAGNILVVSNLGANVIGYVTANGDGTFGAVKSNTVTAQGGNLTLYAAAGDNYVELRPTGNGHVDVGNFRIQSLANPVNAQDAATKFYVDTVAEGLHIHASCAAATPDTLANVSSGTVTYNNGTAGVGATLTTTGTYTLIDGVNVATVGTRILVKDEANLAHNGIYTYTSSTVLTRATDFDTAAEIQGGDFTFVTGGTLYNSTGWVQIDEVNTVGTDPIEWDQFSGAGEYTAGQGLTLTGTVFSVNVDNITTEIAGGNVVVKANAQLTTPNIGAATGTSLDLTGNLLAGNVNSNAKVTGVDFEASGNILAANISANANLVVSNATVNLSLTGNTANFSGNVVVPNLTVNTTLSGNVANFTGNLTAANGNLGNLLTANFANIASNTITNNLTVNLELAGNTANFSGNIVAGNISTSGSGGNITGANVVSANTFSGNLEATYANATGNITGGNLVTSGVANVAQLNVTANVTSDLLPNANLTHDLGNATLRWDNVYAGNVDVSGNVTTSGNLSANNFTANTFIANTAVEIGNTTIFAGEVTTTSITANQTISSVPVSGVTGVEWLVKGTDSTGTKYSMAMITAVTDGANADFATFGTVNLGSSTGTLSVNVVGSNIALQVTPSSSNSTVWVTQYRTL